MRRKPDFSQRPPCPYCDHPTKVYINSHYHRRAPDGSLIHVTSFICSECKRTFSVPKPTNHYNKLFHFPYPRCPHCNRTMQIYKIRRSYVRFRCRSCKFKSNVFITLPNLPVFFSSIRFASNYPFYICLLAFILFYSNLSFRQIKNVLILNGYSPSVSTIYRWVVALSKATKFSPIHFDVLSVDEKFEKVISKDKSDTPKNKSDTLYVYLAVSWDSYFIANFVVSMNRDTFEAIQLISPCEPKLVYSDGLPSYARACEYLHIPHKTIDSKTNQPVESRNSLLAMFTQIRRGFKKLSNVFDYIKAFVVLHNIKRMLRIEYDAKDQAKIQKPLIEYLLNHFEEIFAFQ